MDRTLMGCSTVRVTPYLFKRLFICKVFSYTLPGDMSSSTT